MLRMMAVREMGTAVVVGPAVALAVGLAVELRVYILLNVSPGDSDCSL